MFYPFRLPFHDRSTRLYLYISPWLPFDILQTRLAYARAWHLIDIGNDPRSLGRVASSIALTLMGKHKPIFDPSTDCGDYVVAIDCANLHVTGKKLEQKKYYTHTTRPGSLKDINMDRMMAKWGGGEVLRRAVSGMLPKNRLRKERLARLKTFEGRAHPYKENILEVRLGGGQSIGDSAAVRRTFAEAKDGQAVTGS
jgi:large subunit ribosomal protein L13